MCARLFRPFGCAPAGDAADGFPDEVFRAASVAEIIAPFPMATSEAELKGVSKAMSVYRLARTDMA